MFKQREHYYFSKEKMTFPLQVKTGDGMFEIIRDVFVVKRKAAYIIGLNTMLKWDERIKIKKIKTDEVTIDGIT